MFAPVYLELACRGGKIFNSLQRSRGTVDDLIIYRLSEDQFLLIVNASNIATDLAWLKEHTDGYDITLVNDSKIGADRHTGPLAYRHLLRRF